MPSSGRPTPVRRKPNMAAKTCSPACCPNIAGKIRFPAPKNSANNINPVAQNADLSKERIKNLKTSAIYRAMKRDINKKKSRPVPPIPNTLRKHYTSRQRNTGRFPCTDWKTNTSPLPSQTTAPSCNPSSAAGANTSGRAMRATGNAARPSSFPSSAN